MKNKNKSNRLLISVYLGTLIALAIFSYSQIDLNLTLSANSFYQSLQQKLIHLGYFNRPLATSIYIFLLVLLFATQIVFIRESIKGNLKSKQLWKLSIASGFLLLLAYPAFSHDVFNYIFDARMVVFHKVNPWTHTALDFPLDLWTRFMRWTHRTYPYGPGWLILTIPVYFAGIGKFTLTLLWFKAVGVFSYLANVWFLKRILEIISPKKVAVGMALFALNPLVIIEGLVNAHLDITMSAFLLAAIYFAIQGKKVAGWVLLIISASTKFVTASAIPVWIWWKGRLERFEKAIIAMLTLILLTVGVVIIIQEPLPWYLITPLSLSALLPKKKELQVLAIALSLGFLLRYAPYLLRGDYSEWVKNARDILTLFPLFIAIAWILWKKKKSSSYLFS